MKRSTLLRTVIGGSLIGLLNAAPANAQATRTWVSGTGDDINPCSRTAPCKTFAGAISKTATNGEINCLDPGGFGGVTITKAITIQSDDSKNGGILVSGTNGITINITNGLPTDIVTIRGLAFNGLGAGNGPSAPGLNGIKFLAGAALIVENCYISGFTGSGGFVAKWGTTGPGPGQFLEPVGVAIDAAGKVHVTDWLRMRVLVFTGTGEFIAEWGTQGTGPGEFDAPGGVAADAGGDVFVADVHNNRIQKFGPLPTPTKATSWGRLKHMYR